MVTKFLSYGAPKFLLTSPNLLPILRQLFSQERQLITMNAQNTSHNTDWPDYCKRIAVTLLSNHANPIPDTAEVKFIKFVYLETDLTTNEVALTIVELRQAPHTL